MLKMELDRSSDKRPRSSATASPPRLFPPSTNPSPSSLGLAPSLVSWRRPPTNVIRLPSDSDRESHPSGTEQRCHALCEGHKGHTALHRWLPWRPNAWLGGLLARGSESKTGSLSAGPDTRCYTCVRYHELILDIIRSSSEPELVP
jgi:hypothetical protein